jgi:hypothetical protein
MKRDWNKSKFTSIPVMVKAKEMALDPEPFTTKYVPNYCRPVSSGSIPKSLTANVRRQLNFNQ